MQDADNQRVIATDVSDMLEAIRIVDACDDSATTRLVFEIGAIANEMFSTGRSPKEFFVKALDGTFRKGILERVLFVAMKRIAPTLQIGCDFSDELREAYAILARNRI